MTRRHIPANNYLAGAVLATSMALAVGCQRPAAPVQFRVTMPKAQRGTSTDGRLIVLLSKDPNREPRMQITQNVNTQQIFGIDVDGVAPDGTAVLDAGAVGYPVEK